MKKPSFGTWLSIGSPVVAELAALSGFDWVLLDLEHGSASEACLPDQLRALRGTATKGIVRVGALRPELIARVLDWGADGVMVPHVANAAEAEALVRAARYAPLGMRGYSRTVRAHHYGLAAPEQRAAPVLIAQIETLAAVREAHAIAQVDGIDVLFIGPADLDHDLRHAPSTQSLDFEECLHLVVKAASNCGKDAGILLRDESTLPQMVTQGFNQIAIHSDLAILRTSFASILKRAGTLACPSPQSGDNP